MIKKKGFVMFEFFDKLNENSKKQLDRVTDFSFMLSEDFVPFTTYVRLFVFDDIKTNTENALSAYVFSLEIGTIMDLYRMYKNNPCFWNRKFIENNTRHIEQYGACISEVISDENIEYISRVFKEYKL